MASLDDNPHRAAAGLLALAGGGLFGRTSRRSRRSTERSGGFTLVEMMLAIGILVVGAASLIGVFGVGVATRAAAERRERAVQLADQVLYEIEQRVLGPRGPDGEWPSLEPIQVDSPDDYPALRYRVEFVTDESVPDLVLARIRVGWSEQGRPAFTTFQRVLRRAEPFPRRVSRIRSKP